MKNIADLIEEYILHQLEANQEGKVELRRTDIADEISCAPSQISYVLNTRFTQEKGFVVESRRGLGGFIRVVQVPLRSMIYQDIIEKMDESLTFEEFEDIIHYLLHEDMISRREAVLMLQMAEALYAMEQILPEARVLMLQNMINTLEHFS